MRYVTARGPDECFLNSILTFASPQTYGPSTVCYQQPDWAARPLEERARLLARQGLTYATAEEVRVVVPLQDGESPDTPLVDVPKDGKTIGEIVFRGNIVMKGYFRDPDATARAFRGGYFNSGDLAVWHPDGYIAIMDRSKDIIISGGEVGVYDWNLDRSLWESFASGLANACVVCRTRQVSRSNKVRLGTVNHSSSLRFLTSWTVHRACDTSGRS